MTVWLLLGVGVLFAALGGLNSLLKTIFRRTNISFFDLLLAFLATLILVAALIVTNLESVPDSMIGRFALYTAGGIAALHVLVTLLELFRAQRLRGSRGLLGIFSAALIALSTFTIPFIAVYFDLRAEQTANQGVVPATAVADASSSDPQSGTDESASPEQEERFADLFRAIFGFVAAEIDLPELEIVDQLESGTPLAKIIADNGGDVNIVVSQIAEATREVVRESAAAGEINPVQAALAVSQMETFVRFLVNTDITRLGERVNSGTPDPNATRESLRTLFETPTGEFTPVGETSTSVPPTNQPTNTPTQLPTNTLAPTDSLTPRLTATPSATRFTFATRTPLPTLTPVTPCLASVEYNLRLRTAPNLDSETLLVIPFGEIVELYGRGAPSGGDSFWWLANYDGTEGWLDGQYMIVSRGCDSLPVVAR